MELWFAIRIVLLVQLYFKIFIDLDFEFQCSTTSSRDSIASFFVRWFHEWDRFTQSNEKKFLQWKWSISRWWNTRKIYCGCRKENWRVRKWFLIRTKKSICEIEILVNKRSTILFKCWQWHWDCLQAIFIKIISIMKKTKKNSRFLATLVRRVIFNDVTMICFSISNVSEIRPSSSSAERHRNESSSDFNHCHERYRYLREYVVDLRSMNNEFQLIYFLLETVWKRSTVINWEEF